MHGVKNPQKDDIKIIRTQVPLIPPGEKFRASSVKVDKNGVVATDKRKFLGTDFAASVHCFDPIMVQVCERRTGSRHSFCHCLVNDILGHI